MASPFSNSDHIVIALDEVAVAVRCGLHPWERHPERPNRLLVSVRLYAPVTVARLAQMGEIIDYDRIRAFIAGLAQAEHIDLIETIMDLIIEQCFADPRVAACHVSIRKPDIFADAAGVGVDAYRTRQSWSRA